MRLNPECECGESRKNIIDDIWLKPKYFINGQSAGKLLDLKFFVYIFANTNYNYVEVIILANKITIEFLKSSFEELNFELLSETYSNRVKLHIRCMSCNQDEFVRYVSFNKRVRKCSHCFGVSQIEKMKAELSKSNYQLLTSNYVGSKKYYEVKCNYNHSYKATFDNIIRGNKCPECDKQNRIFNQTLKYEDVKETIESFNYHLISDKYVRSSELLDVRCPKGHEYKVTYSNFYSGKRCLRCIESKGEKRVSEILDSLEIKYFKNMRFTDCKYKNTLPFDFYLENFNTLIEYDGIQHFEKRSFGEKSFEETKIRDSIKNEYCKENNIRLIRIPYWHYENIQEIIIKELNLEESSTTK